MIEQTASSADILQALPPTMWTALPLLPPADIALVLFTRHSIRPKFDSNGASGYGVQLSEQGRALAVAWGAYLTDVTGRRIVHCLSSPIQRCVDTASLMLQGAAQHHAVDTQHIDIVTQQLLVEPGSFVIDAAQVQLPFRTLGAVEFINQFVQNQLGGMKHPIAGVRDILALLFDGYSHDAMRCQQAALTLAVSHDTILAAFIAVISGHFQVQQSDWPQMMEGVFLWFDDGHGNRTTEFDCSVVHWIWRGKQYRLAIHALRQ